MARAAPEIHDATWDQASGGAPLATGGGDEIINVLVEHHFDVADGISTLDTVADDCESVEIVER